MTGQDKKPAWKNILEKFNTNTNTKLSEDKKCIDNTKNQQIYKRVEFKSDINNKAASAETYNPQNRIHDKTYSTDETSNKTLSNQKIIKKNISVCIEEDMLVHIKPSSKYLSVVLSKFPPQKVFYHTKNKEWCVKLDFYLKTVNELKKNFNFKDIPRGIIKALLLEDSKQEDMDVFKIDDNEDEIYLTLLSFQKEGVKQCILKNGRILLADEMGLGKTYQSLAIAHFYRLEWPLLIISPASLLVQWKENVQNFLNKPSTIVKNVGDIGDMINIISYDIATKHYEILKNHKFKVVIADECHYLKNPQAKRTTCLLNILQKSTRLIMLSGTPALSRPIELYNVITALNKDIFKSMTEYGNRYCNLKKIRNFFDWSGSSNCQELDFFLRKCLMIRRTKDEVLTELPEKFRRQVIIEANKNKKRENIKNEKLNTHDKEVKINDSSNSDIEAYNFSSENEINNKKTQQELSNINIDDNIILQYQEAAILKVDPVKNYIKTLIERGLKFIVFAHHVIMLDGLEEFLKKTTKYIRIDGKTPSNHRQKLVSNFQENEDIQVALLSLTACSSGLTLTAGKAVIFAELYWNPGIMLQAEDRIHRIGQKDNVNIHYLVAMGTIDEIVWPILLKKLNVLENIGIGNNNLKGMKSTMSKQKEITDFMKK